MGHTRVHTVSPERCVSLQSQERTRNFQGGVQAVQKSLYLSWQARVYTVLLHAGGSTHTLWASRSALVGRAELVEDELENRKESLRSQVSLRV